MYIFHQDKNIKNQKKGYIGWDYISNNGGIKLKEYKIKFRKLKNK